MTTMNGEYDARSRKNAATKPAQLRLTRRSPAYWRVTIDNPPINVMGPEMVREFQEIINAIEADEQVRVVVFDSAVDDYFLNHADFNSKLEDLTSLPAGPTGLPPWPDFLVRLTRLPVVSIALIRGRATGNGSEITLACDMSFASREKAIILAMGSGCGGWSPGGGLPWLGFRNFIGRNRALEVLLELGRHQSRPGRGIRLTLIAPCPMLGARRVRRSARVTRIAKFDKWAIANTKRLVNTSLPPDVELGAGWDACVASLGRPAAQDGIKALMARGFVKPGDVENRLGYYLASKLRARSAFDAVPNSRRCGWAALERQDAYLDTEGKLEMKKDQREINPASKPSGDGCVECLASPKGWWFFHLRRCVRSVQGTSVAATVLRASMRPSMRRQQGIRSLPASNPVRIGSTTMKRRG